MKKGTVRPEHLSVFDVLRAPLVTEKSTLAAEKNQYGFRVDLNATKQDIKVAVERLYKVNVEKVNTILLKGKVKRFKGRIGKRNDTKKAIVRIAEGQKIDLSSGL